MTRGRWTWLTVLACVIAGTGCGGGRDLGEVPDFALVEASGKPLRRADLRGKVWLATFVFTRCPGICPAMMEVESELQKLLPVRDDLRLVSFSVDPEFDQPNVLEAFAAKHKADRGRWMFLTGDKNQTYQLVRNGFKLGVEEAAPGSDEPIVHSSKMVMVDGRGRIRGYYDTLDELAMTRMLADLDAVLGEQPLFDVRVLPGVNASLNGVAALFLVTGYVSIRRERRRVHIACMILAVTVSALFLVSYLYYHAHAGSTKFAGTGFVRHIYFAILFSHTVLAMVVALWLAPVALCRAARKQYDRHKAIARWTLPVWLYVSVTGVVIYLMLYRWFAPG
jgi:protein SCO1/2/putative membrane protein